MSEEDINNLKEMLVDFNEYSTDYTKTRCRELEETIKNTLKEIERLNKTLEDIDTYIHLCKLEEIGEKTMLILNDILLIKNGMSDEVIRLKGEDKE